MLRTSRINPKMSAYEQLHGKKYDWNMHTMAPPGTRAVIYEEAITRMSWGPHGLDAWYLKPAMDHYRCCEFYVPAMRSIRTSGSFDLFPQHCIMSTFTPEQHAHEVNDELKEAIEKLSKKARRKLLKSITKNVSKRH